MKTYEEFISEAYLYEMRKEDKVRGKKKTPLYVTRSRRVVVKAPDGNEKKWKIVTSQDKSISPEASLGRTRSGLTRGSYELGHRFPAHSSGTQEISGKRHSGIYRGKKKGEQREILRSRFRPPTPLTKEQRKRNLYFKKNPESAVTPERKSLAASLQTGFTQSSKKWN